MGSPHSLPLSISEMWEDFRAEIEEQSDEYEEEGWDVNIFTVGEVRVSTNLTESGTDAGSGLRILIPDNQFDLLSELVQERGRYTCETYKQTIREEAVFLLLIHNFTEREAALFIPLYYRLPNADDMISKVKEQGTLITQFRTIDETGVLSIKHDNPSLFIPE